MTIDNATMITKQSAAPTPGLSAPTQAVRPKNAPRALFDPTIVKRAMKDAFVKLDPRLVAKNPVMFVVEVGSVVTTYFWIRGLITHAPNTLFVGQVSLWLWFTVVFANFAEAMAEGRGKA
jgi:potassium-transporting ATPase ATP-binding subunit